MKSSIVRVASVALAFVAGGTLAATRSASAQEIVEALTPAITTTQFVSLFGKPAAVVGTASSSAPACVLGEVRLFAGPVPPPFVQADGRLLPIDENTALFAELGITFGGDGRTTFGLPSLSAVTPNGLTYAVCTYGTFAGDR
jgi:hypothetical protein